VLGKGIVATVNGKKVKIGSANFVEKTKEDAATTSVVYGKIDNKLLGRFQLENAYRKNLKKVINQLQQYFKLHLVSGDNDSEHQRLLVYFSKENTFLFNQTPEQKLRYIKELQQQNEKVAMIGDGLNDAGALKQSNVGISISEDINTFSPACDAILDAEVFEKLPLFFKYAKTSINIVIASFIISFLYNIVGLSFAVQGLMSPVLAAILMPLSSITVVVFVTVATNLSAKLMKVD